MKDWKNNRTLRRSSLVSLALLFLGPVHGAEAAGKGREPIGLVRFWGRDVPELVRMPIERLGAYSLREGRFEGVLFQVDERDADGDLVFATPSGAKTAHPDGKLHERDEILLLEKDTGEKRRGEPLPPGAVGGMEVKVTAATGCTDGWFYLLAFEGKAPRSDSDYVRYDPKRDWVEALSYTVGFPDRKAIQVPSHFAIREAAGGNGENIYDVYKIRLEIDLKLFGRIRKTQNDFVSSIYGYVDGPLRVTRRVQSALRLAGPIRSSTIESDTRFYPEYCVFPSRFSVPFKLGFVSSRASVRISDDFAPSAKGMTWINDRNPKGVRLTGEPAADKGELDRSAYRWKLVTGPQGTMMNFVDFDKVMGSLEKGLFFVDDDQKPDEPCRFRGQVGNSGYEIPDLRLIPKGTYRMDCYVFCIPDYRKGEEEKYLRTVLHPPTVSAAPLSIE